MNISKILRFSLTAALVVGFSTVVHAQATRTWVSGVGDDANPCSRTAPCKTFAGAISKTAPCGEISVLDPGGFGAVTITKAMTINGTGTLAGILSALANAAVIVNAGANDTVILRDISMNGACSGVNGIRYLAGKTLMVDHCWIYGLTTNGIDVAKTADGNLKVFDTVIENIGVDGIHMTTTVGIVTAIVDRSRIMNCAQDGIEAANNVRLELTNSAIFINANGVITSGNNSQLNLDDTSVSHSQTVGLKASAGSAIRVSDSMIANNSTGLSQNGGTIDSFQGNSLIGNVVPGSFTSTTAKQ
jgi:hypothetical protein